MSNEKMKKFWYIIGAFVCGTAFIGLCGFLIDFSNGRALVNMLFTLLAVIMACTATFLGRSVLYKETATWSTRRWASEMILPILLTIAMILFVKK